MTPACVPPALRHHLRRFTLSNGLTAQESITLLVEEVLTAHRLTTLPIAASRADEVLAWLTHRRPTEFSLRDVHGALKGRVWVSSAQDLRAALAVLVDRGSVLPVPSAGARPGRPSERYQLADQTARPLNADP